MKKIIILAFALFTTAAVAQPVTTRVPTTLQTTQCSSAQLVLGSGVGSVPVCATLGTNLSFTGTTLNAAGSGGASLPSATTSQLYGGSGVAGTASIINLGTNLSITGGVLNATGGGGGGSGTVTSVGVLAGNGFSGSVANATTTPNISITTTVVGIAKGNGAALSAAVAGTDYQGPITLTTTGTSGAATFTGTTLNIPNYAGTTSCGIANQVLYNNSSGNCSGSAGFAFNGAAGLTLGQSGTSTGAVSFQNATSGVLVVQAPNTGALGSNVITLPIKTDTLAVLGDFTTRFPTAMTSQLYGGSGTAGSAVVVSVGNNLSLSSGTALTFNPSGPATSVQFNNAAVLSGVIGFTFDGTSKIRLGLSTASVGSIDFQNLTSGIVTLQPTTGPLGSSTITIPAVTGTMLTTAAPVTVAQGGTNLATLTANNVILGNGTNSPNFVAPGTSGNSLVSNGTTWVSAAGAGITLTTTGTAGASTLTGSALNIPQYQGAITLTTTGTSGAATFAGNTLNIPSYTGAPGGSNTQVQYNNSGVFGGVAGWSFDGTSKTTLGVAGTSVGAVAFNNATSGSITLQPATGALGITVLSLPSGSDTLVTLAATQTLTNKSIAASQITGVLAAANGGTGVANSNTITLGGNLITAGVLTQSGAFATTLTSTATTNSTFPAGTHTLAGLDVAQSFTATQTYAGTTATPSMSLLNAVEPITVSATAATGTINLYANTQSILYYTSNASANWTTNLSFSSGTTFNTAMTTGQTITLVFMVTQGTTAFYNTVLQIDGSTSGVTTKWQGGAPISGNASGIDVYTYAVTKTASATFTVLASQTQFK
jgi:hypothetical protein